MQRSLLSFVLLVVWGFISVAAESIADQWAIIPAPQQIELHKGKAIRSSAVTFVEVDGCNMPVLFGALAQLPHARRDGVGVYLRIDSIDSPLSPEGYLLEVSNKGVVVRSRTKTGLMYGAVTLQQIMAQSHELDKPIPPMIIKDWPSTDFRAVHIDTKHHLDRMEYYYRLIDRLAQWKVNNVIWEIEDKLRYERRSECAAPNAISKQEMQALCRYAYDRGIAINPLVQGLGHAGFILKHHSELRENPESDWEFCPSDSCTYELQFDLYRDAIEAMPYGKYLHVGGDEITAIGNDARCKVTGMSPFQLQMVWLGRVCDFAKSVGRTPIFWDDMPFKYANLWWVLHGGLSDEEVERNWKTDKLEEAVALFPKDCVYMRWLYDDPDYLAHRKILDWYSHHNLQVMGATAASDGGSTFMPRHGSKIGHIRSFCRLRNEYGLEGIFATAWDDGSPHSETFMRGYAALGEWAWNPDGRTEDEFKCVHAMREFGLEPGQTDFIEELETAANFCDGALVVKGRRNPAWQIDPFTLIDLPDPLTPGKWSETYAAKLDSAKIVTQLFPQTLAKIKTAQAQALRNRYTLDVYEQNLYFFNWSSRLLLALEAFDNANSDAERARAKACVLNVADDFAQLRADLERVYSETRFINQPNGYLPDMNHHNHLAALSLDNSWFFLYELAILPELYAWAQIQP